MPPPAHPPPRPRPTARAASRLEGQARQARARRLGAGRRARAVARGGGALRTRRNPSIGRAASIRARRKLRNLRFIKLGRKRPGKGPALTPAPRGYPPPPI